jgi:hypothetical protein
VADIKTVKNHDRGALFLVCPVHGPDRAQGAKAQTAIDEWITDHAIAEGAEKVPESVPEQVQDGAEKVPKVPEPEKPAAARVVPEPSRKGPGFLSRFFKSGNDQLNEFMRG